MKNIILRFPSQYQEIIRHNYADITLARTILGYEPKWSFSDGIGEFCKWVNTQEIQADMYDASILEMKEKGLYK